jgi:hypothetical protein
MWWLVGFTQMPMLSAVEFVSQPGLWSYEQHGAERMIEDKTSDMADGFWLRRMRRRARRQDTAIADDDEVDRHCYTQAHNLLFGPATQHHAFQLLCIWRVAEPLGAEGSLREEVSATLAHAQVALAEAFHLMAGTGIGYEKQRKPQVIGVEQGECLSGQEFRVGSIKAAYCPFCLERFCKAPVSA